MAGNIGVDMSVVKSTSESIRSENRTMKTNLNGISEGVSNLRSSWQSEAANELSNISSRMSSRFADLEKSVESFAVFLDGVVANYEATERQAVSSQQSISNMFNN